MTPSSPPQSALTGFTDEQITSGFDRKELAALLLSLPGPKYARAAALIARLEAARLPAPQYTRLYSENQAIHPSHLMEFRRDSNRDLYAACRLCERAGEYALKHLCKPTRAEPEAARLSDTGRDVRNAAITEVANWFLDQWSDRGYGDRRYCGPELKHLAQAILALRTPDGNQ